MMEYEYVEGQAEQLKHDLLQGRVCDEAVDAPLDSDEIEALEEEEKLVRSLVRKGTMQKQHLSDCEPDD